MPTVAHAARNSSRDMSIGPVGVGVIMPYHSIRTAPGLRPLRRPESLSLGEELSAIHSSTSRTSSLAIAGLSTISFISASSTKIEAALGSTAKLLGVGVGTAVVVGRSAAVQAA